MNRTATLTSSISGLPGWFIALFCTVMPLNSFVLIPSVQGTVPAYMLAFASAFFVITSRDGGESNVQRARYFRIALAVAGIWLLLFCGSQLGHLLSNRRDFGDMNLINPDNPAVLFRSTIFTQSLYFAACVCIALFFRFFFREEWMRYVLWGGWFLALYGIYEWVFFLIFQHPGDFIVNRTYGNGAHTASWSQVVQIGSFSLLRIKSTFGEPSFFSAGVVPYFFLAQQYKRKWLSLALLFCILFSTSTSAYVAFPFALALQSLFQRKLSRATLITILLFLAAFATLYYVFPETYNQMFTEKMNGENNSGQTREDNWDATQETLKTFTLMNRLFGIGFGYYYGGVYYAILVNTGLIGMLVYFYAFLKPVIFLRPDHTALAFKVALAALFFLFYISVSELFLPSTWMFLGLAYWRLDQQKDQRRAIRTGSLESQELGYALPTGNS
jgi:O-Antigen ligase